MIKSNGHLCFLGVFEYYLVDDLVLRSPISNCVMPDGYRSGQFECSLELAKCYQDSVYSFLFNQK
jgi:hypothetical protein